MTGGGFKHSPGARVQQELLASIQGKWPGHGVKVALSGSSHHARTTRAKANGELWPCSDSQHNPPQQASSYPPAPVKCRRWESPRKGCSMLGVRQLQPRLQPLLPELLLFSAADLERAKPLRREMLHNSEKVLGFFFVFFQEMKGIFEVGGENHIFRLLLLVITGLIRKFFAGKLCSVELP